MEKTSFVCIGRDSASRAFVYSELPRKRSSEEFFAFFMSGNPAHRDKLKRFFRKAISGSRMGTARNYFLRYLNETGVEIEECRDIINESIIILMIKRGDRIHMLFNRGVRIIHWNGAKREMGTPDILTELELESGSEQPDLFEKSAEDLFFFRRINKLSGNHTILFAPSEEFAARYREEFLDSVFFPSFRIPDRGRIALDTDCDIPGIHWNREPRRAEDKERFRDKMKKMNVSIPVITGVAAAIIAVFIFFNPFGGGEETEMNENNLLLSAQDEKINELPGEQGSAPPPDRDEEADNAADINETDNLQGGSETGSTQKRRVASENVALKRSWKKKFSRPVTSSPATAGKGIIFGCRDGYIYCLSESGEMEWKHNMGAGVGSSPVIIPGDRVICADYQGDLVCLETGSGNPVWSIPLKSKVISTPACDGKLVFVGTMEGALHCIDSDIGEKVWKRKLGPGIWSSIRAENNCLVAATVDGYIKRLNYNGKLIWSQTAGREIYSTPLCIPEDDLILVGSSKGLVSVFTLSEGKLRWQYSVNDEVRSTPAYSGDNVVVGTDEGKLYCFSRDGRMKWMQDLGGAIRSRPLIRDRIVYITAYNRRMTAIDVSTGNIIAEYDVESQVYSSPLFFGGRIFFGTNAGFLHSVEVVSG